MTTKAVDDYFQKLGERVRSRIRGKKLEGDLFSTIATETLQEFPPPSGLGFDSFVKWALRLSDLPDQGQLTQNFGHPPTTVYKGPGFYIEVLIWSFGRTAIHGHGFSGAFQVLQGDYLQFEFDHLGSTLLEDGLLVGSLQPKSIRFLKAGQAIPILNDSLFIHSVVHLSEPTITLIIRTDTDKNVNQFNYFRSGLAYSPFRRKQLLTRQVQVLEACYRIDPELFWTNFESYLKAINNHGRMFIIQALDRIFHINDDLKSRLYHFLVAQNSATDKVIFKTTKEIVRSANVWNSMELFKDPVLKRKAILADFLPEFQSDLRLSDFVNYGEMAEHPLDVAFRDPRNTQHQGIGPE